MIGGSRGPPADAGAPRQRVLAYLKENPGASLQEIADHLGVTRNAASYHVHTLRQKKGIVRQRQGRRVLHFLSGIENQAKKSALGLIRQKSVRPVLEAILRDPALSWRSMGKRLGMSAHAVRWHIRRLSREGLLQVIRSEDRASHFVLVHPEIRFLLERHHASRLEAPPPSAQTEESRHKRERRPAEVLPEFG